MIGSGEREGSKGKCDSGVVVGKEMYEVTGERWGWAARGWLWGQI